MFYHVHRLEHASRPCSFEHFRPSQPRGNPVPIRRPCPFPQPERPRCPLGPQPPSSGRGLAYDGGCLPAWVFRCALLVSPLRPCPVWADAGGVRAKGLAEAASTLWGFWRGVNTHCARRMAHRARRAGSFPGGRSVVCPLPTRALGAGAPRRPPQSHCSRGVFVKGAGQDTLWGKKDRSRVAASEKVGSPGFIDDQDEEGGGGGWGCCCSLLDVANGRRF